MSANDTEDQDKRAEYDICGAKNRNGNPCQLPSGWGTPGSGGSRCKFHGGCSTGPDDTSHLEGNDFAEGNSGGRPPENNDNAVIHGGWSDWRNYYQRLDGDDKEYVSRLVEEFCNTAAEHAPDVDPERREELAREAATLMILRRDASQDVWNDNNNNDDQDDDGSRSGSARGRGLILEDETGRQRVNPAHNAVQRLRRRGREIAKELSLWSGFQ
jgi:hypothetical protein